MGREDGWKTSRWVQCCSGVGLYRAKYRARYREKYRARYREKYRARYRVKYRVKYRETYMDKVVGGLYYDTDVLGSAVVLLTYTASLTSTWCISPLQLH